jgi:hypothetical protein
MNNDEINQDEYVDFSINNIINLYNNLEKLFIEDKIYNLYIEFPQEYYHGFIEYKRTLATYDNKIDKLRTQILWRLSEGLIHNQKELCYYIIGLEDNGKFPLLNIELTELEMSRKMIEQCIVNTQISMDYRYLSIEKENKIILIVRMWCTDESNHINIKSNWNIGII